MISNIELLTIFAGIMEICQIYLLSKKIRLGFIFGIIGAICWITYSVISGNAVGLLLVCSVTFVLNGRGFYLWSKTNDKKESD